MNEINGHESKQTKTASKSLSVFSKVAREVLALFCWGYVFVKLFVFDLDVFLITKYFPNYAWIVEYKFFILIGMISIVLLTTKNRQILIWSLYIFFYPAIVFLWKIPFLVFKTGSWNLAFVLVDSLISFIKSFKKAFVTASFFLITTVVILTVSNRFVLWISMIGSILIVLVVYIQKISLVIKPSGIYQAYSSLFSFMGNNVQKINNLATANDKTDLTNVDDEQQIQSRTTHIEQLVFFNRICLFVAKKLKTYQDSGTKIMSAILSVLFLFLFTVFSFAVLNYGLFKTNQELFSFPALPTFFNFFFYSFNAFFFNSIQEITATTAISQTVLMVEYFFALFLVGIFISLLLSIRSQKDIDELNEVIRNLTKEGEQAEGYIKDHYYLDSIEAAMKALKELKTSLIDILYKMTETL